MHASVVRTASPVPRVTVPDPGADGVPEVSVVIVTYGTGPIVVDTIDSVVATAGEIAIEVIVVDNVHPTRGERTRTELLVDTAGVRLVTPDANLGFGGGCELGALYARGRFLAFVNPDVTAIDGWLDALTAALDGDEALSIVAPVLVNPDHSVQECGQALFADGTTEPLLDEPGVEPIRVDYASAACWVLRREEHERIGGFDPAFHPAYFEDADLALRAASLGGGCAVIPTASVVHHLGQGTPDDASPAHAQRERLREMWPAISWMQPPPATLQRRA